MVFKNLARLPFGYLNLDTESQRFLRKRCPPLLYSKPSPFLSAQFANSAIKAMHSERGMAWSYGGWLENRRRLLGGSYLEESGNWTHLGVDYNVPAGTAVHADANLEILLTDKDVGVGGWGSRVIAKIINEPIVLIYAHLHPTLWVEKGQFVRTGTLLGKVGYPSHNGHWWPHLHGQAIDAGFYFSSEFDLKKLDGYGHPDNLVQLARAFPDPLQFIKLL